MDISSYNLKQIDSALSTIDKDKYPVRFNELTAAKAKLVERVKTLEDELESVTGTRLDYVRESNIKSNKLFDIALYSFIGVTFITLVITIVAVFGGNTISWNGGYVHGIPAILLGVIHSIFFGIIVMLITSIGMGISKLILRR